MKGVNSSDGWSPTLIPDRYLIETFFQKEAKEIEDLEVAIGEREAALAEAVEAAQTLLEYEAEEDESITAALMRKELTAAIRDLKNGKAPELPRLQDALNNLKETEDALRELKKKLDQCQYDLEVKIALKKFGPEEETWEARRLKEQAEKELAGLEPGANSKQLILTHLLPNHDSQSVRPEPFGYAQDRLREAKSKAKRLRSDIATLEQRIETIRRLSNSIGGMITESEAKALILQKHHDLVAEQMNRYLNAEKRAVLQFFENLWIKYMISSQRLEDDRKVTLTALHGFFKDLNYLTKLTE